MKKIMIAASALLLAACAPKEKALENEVGPYTIDEILPNVYHIQDFNTSNAGETFNEDGEKTHFNNCSDMYLFAGSEKALLIDLSNKIEWADNAAESLQKLVSDRIGDTPLTITFTHNHGDHTGMLSAFIDNADVHFALPRVDFESLTDNVPAGQYSMYDDGEKFNLGDMTLSSLLVPGHTHGSVVFFLDGKNLVFTGDAIGSGHGVWIFNREGFDEYVQAVPKLIAYIQDPANGIDQSALQIYGGHYWQKDWLELPEGRELDMQYILDMQTLIDQIKEGSAYSEPSNLNFGALDTYFRLNNSIIVWNLEQAGEFAAEQQN